MTFGMTVGLAPVQTLVSSFVASIFAGGRWFSPDLDQSFWWRLLDEFLPDELLDRARYRLEGREWSPSSGGPMQHRGITHAWILPAIWTVALVIWWPSWWWVIAGAIVGWTSHLVMDFVFGLPDPFTKRGGGIPMWLWFHHRGLELDTGGPAEKVVTVVILPAVLFVQALFFVGLGPRLVHAAVQTIAGG